MATTAKITLTNEQIEALAIDLRVAKDAIPGVISIVAIAPEAADVLGVAISDKPQFSPAVIIT